MATANQIVRELLKRKEEVAALLGEILVESGHLTKKEIEVEKIIEKVKTLDPEELTALEDKLKAAEEEHASKVKELEGTIGTLETTIEEQTKTIEKLEGQVKELSKATGQDQAQDTKAPAK